MTALDFLRLLIARLWSGRPINVEATRQTDGAEPDSDGGDSSPAAAEVRLLPWDLGSYHRCHADQPHQLEERVGMVGREGGSTPQIAYTCRVDASSCLLGVSTPAREVWSCRSDLSLRGRDFSCIFERESGIYS